MKRYLLLFVVLLLFAACGNTNNLDTNNNNEEERDTVSFRQIDIVTEGEDVFISGEMKSWDGNFYYHLLAGEEVIYKESKVESEHKGFWSPFKLTFSKANLLEKTAEVPHIALYGKDSDGETINPNYVPIDLGEK